ncbi:MAG: ComEC/Rec2 family competence protein [Candidatus Moranbacteria bacterium]|nr:ComEC/Rec2 family competence protein [Candidatus Moranbacteria bacterium]
MSDVVSLIRRSFPMVIPGVFLGSIIPASSPVAPLLVCAIGASVIAVWPSRKGIAFALCCVAFSTGCLRSSVLESEWNRVRPIGVTGGVATVVRNPEQDDGGKRAVLGFDTCDTESVCPDGLVLATFSIRSDISYGDTLELSCPLEVPDEKWRMYYAKDGIAYRCRVSSWKKTGERNFVRRALFGFSSAFESALSRALTEPEAGLAAGLVIGGGRRLPDSLVSDFRAAGLSHIVAVSGYNISIIAASFLLLGVACFLPRHRAAVFSLVATAAFVMVSGAPASAMRAFGMSSVLVSAGWFGRRYASIRAIVMVATAMLLWNPLLLRHDIGFLLSFAATAGIALTSPWIGRVMKRVSHGGFFVEAALLTFCANLFVMPIIFANFGSFSPLSFLANTLLLPLVPYAMFLSILTGIAGMIMPSLGSLLAFPAYATIRPIVLGAEWLADLSHGMMIETKFGWIASVIWYMVLAILLRLSFLAMRYSGGYSEEGYSFRSFLLFMKSRVFSLSPRVLTVISKEVRSDS